MIRFTIETEKHFRLFLYLHRHRLLLLVFLHFPDEDIVHARHQLAESVHFHALDEPAQQVVGLHVFQQPDVGLIIAALEPLLVKHQEIGVRHDEGPFPATK